MDRAVALPARVGLVLALVLLGTACERRVDVDFGLPPPYDALVVPAERLDSEAAVRRGRALYLSYCAMCHGPEGRGDGPRAGILASRPRDMTSPRWQAAMSPRRTYAAIHAGRPASGMPSWRSLDEEQIWDLVAYVRSL
ncbi:MAG TPA: cytochrome c [Thermoanaerobaculia bacterium]|nr:cytochrome c [Thermoanaerobaculia bacterium]